MAVLLIISLEKVGATYVCVVYLVVLENKVLTAKSHYILYNKMLAVVYLK